MKSASKLILLLLVCSLVNYSSLYGQGISISSGAHLVVSDTLSLVLNNAKFENNGTFSAGKGQVLFTGSADYSSSIVEGSSSTTFFHLKINKAANGVRLSSLIAVDSTLMLSAGSIDLNGKDITFNSGGQLLGETSSKCIWGDSGEVAITVNLNSPNKVNPGNLGLEITSSKNFGSTLIKRGHKQPANGAGGLGIKRYFEISPTTNTALNATLRMYYLDTELSGITESELDLWRFNGSTWDRQNVGNSSTYRDSSNNWLEKSGINAFSIWTLGSPVNNPLPVELLSFKAYRENKVANLEWITASEVNNQGFEVQRSQSGADWTTIGFVHGNGTTNEMMNYKYKDENPFEGKNFYRLRQLDFNGQEKYSSIEMVDFDVTAGLRPIILYPNPATDFIALNFQEESAIVTIMDVHGRILLEDVNYSPKSQLSLQHLTKATYWVRVKTLNQTETFLLVKH